jgi:hypothetical protein
MNMPMSHLDDLRLDLDRDPRRHHGLPIATRRIGERPWEGWLYRKQSPPRLTLAH